MIEVKPSSFDIDKKGIPPSQPVSKLNMYDLQLDTNFAIIINFYKDKTLPHDRASLVTLLFTHIVQSRSHSLHKYLGHRVLQQ